MFGKPISRVSQIFHVLGQIHRSGDGAARGLSGAHADEIQYRNRQPIWHTELDDYRSKEMRMACPRQADWPFLTGISEKLAANSGNLYGFSPSVTFRTFGRTYHTQGGA